MSCGETAPARLCSSATLLFAVGLLCFALCMSKGAVALHTASRLTTISAVAATITVTATSSVLSRRAAHCYRNRQFADYSRSFTAQKYSRPSQRLSMSDFSTSASSGADSVRELRAKVLPCSVEGIRLAAEALKRGELVAFPTETVYGLGAHALNASAVQAIFDAKKRPNSDPLIVHVHSVDSMDLLFEFPDDPRPREVCNALAKAFWPGPLTIIYKAKSVVPLVVTSGTGFVGIRCPRHPVAQQLLEVSQLPVAAPSANRFGHVSPTSSLHVLDDLGEEEISVLEDEVGRTGGCSIGIESTVCRVAQDGKQISILRCGAIGSFQIESTLRSLGISDCAVSVDNERALKSSHGTAVSKPSQSESTDEAAVAPGQMMKHYAPDVPAYVLEFAALDRILLSPDDSFSLFVAIGESTGLQHYSPASLNKAFIIDYNGKLGALKSRSSHYVDLSPAGDVEEACNKLFDTLRSTEKSVVAGVEYVILPDLRDVIHQTDSEIGDRQFHEMLAALWERLHRAASGSFIIAK